MANNLLFLCLALFTSQTIAFEFWNDLRVRWDWAPVPPAFARLPRNTADAQVDGWVQDSVSCANDGLFNGLRWIFPSDMGVALLFDTKGNVAGMQSLAPQQDFLSPNHTFSFDRVPMYQNQTINGVTYFAITVYFVAPDTICSTTHGSDIENIGISSQVYFQNGPSPAYLKHAPKTRAAAASLGWTINNCVPGMGWHNFFEVEKYEDSNCNEVQPTCILFDENDRMHGFCLTYPGMSEGSDRWEHPTPPAIEAILGNAPQCYLDQVAEHGATTVHIYFTNSPWSMGC